MAEGILEWARSPAQGPAQAPLFELGPGSPPGQPTGPRGPAGTGGRGLPVLQRTLSMNPLLTASGVGSATGPVLMLIKCPEGAGPQLAELVRLFKAHDVRHMITLGPLPPRFLPEPTLFKSAASLQSHEGYSWLDRSSVAPPVSQAPMGPSWFANATTARPFRAGYASTLTLIDTTRAPTVTSVPSSTRVSLSTTPAAAPPSATSATSAAPLAVERLHVAVPTPGLLEPSALLSITQWLRTHTKPGDRVAVMAEEPNDGRRHLPDNPALMSMGGQLAMAVALQQTQALGAGRQQAHPWQPSEAARRTTLLTAAARDLHRLNPALLGDTLHLSALLEAEQAWAELNARAATPPVGGPFWMAPRRITRGSGAADPDASKEL